MKTVVLVVGAGPAGSCTAREIARAGLDVLAIDRREEIGYPVQCGEFIPMPDELRRILPESEAYGDLFEIDPSIIEKETRYIDLYGPRGSSFSFKFNGLTVDRRRYDKMLWNRAEQEGARLLTGVEFRGLKSGASANTSAGEIDFDVIVGADGPLSRVRRALSLDPPKSISQAITAQATGDWGDRVSMYFGPVAPGGYAWIIPKKETANVGLGVQKVMSSRPLTELFRLFLKKHGIKCGEATYGQVPVSGPVEKTVRGSGLLVGDAAGQVMATNGGGIPIAMICGRIAGRCISSALKGGPDLGAYEVEWRRQVYRPLRNAARTKAIADRFLSGDLRLEFAMKILRSRGLERAILCKRLFYVF